MKEILSLKTVQDYLNNIDKNSLELLKIWSENKNNTSDEFFTEPMNCKITLVRSILNKLHYHGIVNYTKIKDKNSGWYSFNWKIEPKKLAKIVLLNNSKDIERLKEKLEYYKNYQIFECDNNCQDFPFEVAIKYNFECPMCCEELKYINYNKKAEELENEIKLIEKENKSLIKFIKNEKN